MNVEYAPIVIFAYNRPNNLRRLMTSLMNCREFYSSDVHVYIDGPKSMKDLEGVTQTKEYIRTIEHGKLKVIASDENRGLKNSLIGGISEVLASNAKAIILEDDLVVSPTLLTFLNAALSKYENNPLVWTVCGYMYDVIPKSAAARSVFLPFTHPWGWATWAQRWNKFISTDSLTTETKKQVYNSPSFQMAFDVNGLRDFSAMLKLDDIGEINSWFINFYFAMFLNRGMSLFPTRSLITNAGLSGGTHASTFNPYSLLKGKSTTHCGQIDLNSDCTIDYQFLDLIIRSYDARLQKKISQLGRIKRLSRRKLQSFNK